MNYTPRELSKVFRIFNGLNHQKLFDQCQMHSIWKYDCRIVVKLVGCDQSIFYEIVCGVSRFDRQIIVFQQPVF